MALRARHCRFLPLWKALWQRLRRNLTRHDAIVKFSVCDLFMDSWVPRNP